MKTILISDLETKRESVIPYALNFTKHIDDTLQIIHLVDSRKQKVASSAYADSQTFEVSKKLNYTEVKERDLHQNRLALDRILSKEASRLNYPLRVNTVIEENSIESRLNSEQKTEETSIILASSEMEGTIFHDLDEFLEVAGKYGKFSLLIPPGHSFKTPQRVAVYHDFEKGNKVDLSDVLSFLKCFKPEVTIVDVTNKRSYKNLLDKSIAWQKVTQKEWELDLLLHTELLGGENKEKILIDFFNQMQFDLLAIPLKKSKGIGLYSSGSLNQLILETGLPIILY